MDRGSSRSRLVGLGCFLRLPVLGWSGVIQLRWTVSGHAGPQYEDYADADYDEAKIRYENLVNHLRCHDIQMILTHENKDDSVELEHHR